MGNFKVGDVCELVYATSPERQRYVGTEYIVTSELKQMHHSIIGKWMGHDVLRCDGTTEHAMPDQLRLKRPPNKDEFTSGEWELCPWSPYRVGETTT